ncbi:MAG: tryptophan-rich sensory protein [Polyangiaceae bacterium]|nr:tryptophan-rich sensory protein [Polyangiaceae bacterium]
MYSGKNRAIRRLIGVGIFGGLTLLTSIVGSIVNVRGMQSWYDALEKPSFQPPGVAFGIAWTILYDDRHCGRSSFSGTFEPGSHAGADVVVCPVGSQFRMDAALFRFAATVARAGRHGGIDLRHGSFHQGRSSSRFRCIMDVLPYLLWLGFAATLNAEIIRLNPEWARSAMTVLNG